MVNDVPADFNLLHGTMGVYVYNSYSRKEHAHEGNVVVFAGVSLRFMGRRADGCVLGKERCLRLRQI